jgi:RNA polymerase sigma factor (sigma-70 family)
MNAIRLSPEMSAERRVIVEQTVAAERNRLFNFIKKRVSDPGDAEDILQDVFYQLWQGYDTIENVERITSWMFRVARNKIIDRYRKLKPVSFSEIESVRADDEAPLLIADILGDTSSSPDDVYTRELIWESIEEVLAELPKNQRQVFVWHELEDLSFREMSERTGESINTLLSRKRYAVNYLRKRLQNLYNEI